MREEAEARPGTVFWPAVADAPGRPQEEDEHLPQRRSKRPGLQHLCTRALARVRAEKVNRWMLQLPPDDQRSIA